MDTWIQRGGIIEDDEQKALDYPTVKKLIDEYHKVCISKALNREAFGDESLKSLVFIGLSENC